MLIASREVLPTQHYIWRVGGGFLLLPARGPAWMGFVGRLLQDVSWTSGKLLGWGTKRTCVYVSYLPPNAREGFLRVISTGVHTHCHIGRKKKVHSPEKVGCEIAKTGTRDGFVSRTLIFQSTYPTQPSPVPWRLTER